MKAALLIPELIKEGGGELQCVSLASEMQKMGHRVTIFTSEYDFQKLSWRRYAAGMVEIFYDCLNESSGEKAGRREPL